MAAGEGYVSGGRGLHGDHVVKDRPDLESNMWAVALCGEPTVTFTTLASAKLGWRPVYGGCVNCLAAYRASR